MRNPRFKGLLSFMESLHDSKNADYASDGNPYSNFEEAAQTAAGFAGVDAVFASLIGVKLARLRELTRAGKTPNHEGIQDTRRDLAMYAALWASYYEAVPDSGISNATFITNERVQPTNNRAINRAIVARNTATIPPTATVTARPTYDDIRANAGCSCGKLFTHPQDCQTAGRCLALDHPHAT